MLYQHAFVGLLPKCKYSLMHRYGTCNVHHYVCTLGTFCLGVAVTWFVLLHQVRWCNTF